MPVSETAGPGISNISVRATAATALADAMAVAASLGSAGVANTAGAAGDVKPDHLVPPFAWVEKTPHGPRLIVGGICVHKWISSDYEADADSMAAEINRVFLSSRRQPTEPWLKCPAR